MARLALKTSMSTFPVVGRCRNRSGTVSWGSAWSVNPDLPLELQSHVLRFQRYKHFHFGGHIAIFGYQLLSQSLGDIFIELAMIENTRFALKCRRYMS